MLRLDAALTQDAGWSHAVSWAFLAVRCYLESLTVILAAIVCAGVVVGVHAVALAKFGERHLRFWEQALNLHETYR